MRRENTTSAIMARILSYGESTLVALLQIKVLDPVRAFCRSFRLNSPRKGRGAGAGGPLLPFPMSPARTRASAMRTYHHCKPRLLRPFALFKPEQLLIIALREALSQNRGQPVDQPHAAERLSSIPFLSRPYRDWVLVAKFVPVASIRLQRAYSQC